MTSAEYYEQRVLQDMFLEQVPKTPNAIAVEDPHVSLTYAELNAVTDTLAIQLVEDFGVRPDSVVGILLPRGVAYVVAYVAILKAGGAYMPLELVYPKAMLQRAVTQTEAKVVLTNATYANRVEGHACIVLNDGKSSSSSSDKDNNNKGNNNICDYSNPQNHSYPSPNYVRPNADHLAFVVMSSGTTGAPKGICQTHRAAVHSYEDRLKRYPYHPEGGERTGAGIFFVWELYRPLCAGATCVCIPDHVLFDPVSVTDYCATQRITSILVTPSLMQLILDTLDVSILSDRLQGLQYLWFCGEVVSTDLAQACASLLSPSAELLNLYSISECHDVSIGDLRRELDADRKYATCGKSIPGVHFYIVDLEEEDDSKDKFENAMKLVPAGESGEVYVGGPVVGRGYLNMPEKTAERFVPNPFLDGTDTTIHAPRLYRTGDLGRILPNGHLEILGRCDFMVKIRGYSVVLGAVETALAKHPKLSSAVVMAEGHEGSKDKKLVAYVVPTLWSDPPSASSVRTFLKDHVPPYAIPGTFCVMDALPVGAGAAGKLDRKQLIGKHDSTPRLRAFSEDVDDPTTTGTDNSITNATTTTTATVTKRQRAAPTNFSEQGIVDIWAGLLELRPQDLSTTDSFFEVGGHSLLATQLVKQINEKFGLGGESSFSVIHVVEEPTVQGMADKVIALRDGTTTTRSSSSNAIKVDLEAEAQALDPSIYPFPTRKGNTMSRFRLQSSLMSPRVIFLTGATGWLGVHILAELLRSGEVTVIALARADTNDAARDRLVKTLQKHNLLETLQNHGDSGSDQENMSPQQPTDDDDDTAHDPLDKLVAVAGDFSKPLLGLDGLQFKSLALEIDSIIHCGAQVNLMKPYASLKEPNVLGTQEILRLATTNGLVQTKVKPVHYISTNGIFPVDAKAYDETPICVKEDVLLEAYAPHLSEGYAMTKWVAEKMCTIAEERGLPVSVMRPGNMAGSSLTGTQNPDDLNYLLMKAIIATGCAPIKDTNYCLDLTPVDYAAKAVVHLAVDAPQKAIGQRFHLQNPRKPVALTEVVTLLTKIGYDVEAVTRNEFVERLAANADQAQIASGWHSFEPYFVASTWLQYGSDNLQFACSDAVTCPVLDETLLLKWFPKKKNVNDA